MTAWTNYVKQYAKDKGITYKNALKDPACASSYKSGKDKPAEPAKEDNIQMKIEEKPKKRGRPKKYATPEEAKKAKSAKTMESNKRKKAEKGKKKSKKDADSSSESGSDMEGGAIIGKPIGMPNPLASSKTEKEVIKELKGKGILAGYTTENANGLAHIYPISHELVLQMLSCCPKK